jgi:hypothetical protein
MPAFYCKPEDHPKNCRFCKRHPWCPDCYGHHGPVGVYVEKVNGPRPVRAILFAGGKQDRSFTWPHGDDGREAEEMAIQWAMGSPGGIAVVEKRGTWFDANRWERFLTVGPFDSKGQPLPVKDEGLEHRKAYLVEQQRRAEERERLAAHQKSVADARRKDGRRRR